MPDPAISLQAAIPSVDRVLRLAPVSALIEAHGRPAVTGAVRVALSELREALADGGNKSGEAEISDEAIVARIAAALEAAARPTLRPVFNLTGTVLHTNLGRASLPQEAIQAMAEVAATASNLEYDIATGRRGDRDSHLEELVCRLTGAAAATVVNNNAAAVLLVLNTLALRKEVPVSRGELIEIGGAFRMPDIMARAGCKLVEVGTTNRTHARDYADAIGPKTALVMKVHTSNYVVQGFTATVAEGELAAIAHEGGVPLVVDLGSGSLVDLSRWGLPHEPTAAEMLAGGADLITFSGDKLLGGPQAGIIAGSEDLVARVKRNPMKRALRVDKMTIAALAAVLQLHTDPDRLANRLPTLRLLTRTTDELESLARRIAPVIKEAMGDAVTVGIEPCQSQIGSGSLPTQGIESVAISIWPNVGKKGAGKKGAGKKSTGSALKRIAASFRALPVPVIGRVQDDAFMMDLRCLVDEAGFIDQLARLSPGDGKPPGNGKQK
jgi:L-seryl-tRNA(Ser) seleniumtransferase